VALYHIGHRHAGGIKEIPDIQVVGRQDELEESALIHGKAAQKQHTFQGVCIGCITQKENNKETI